MSGLFNSDAVNELLAFFKGRNEGLSAIGQTTLAGSVASVTFDLTDYQQFRHLLLIVNARSDRASANDTANLRFNADSGNNYDTLYNIANNGAVSSATSTAVTSLSSNLFVTGANGTAGNFGGGYSLIQNYTNTNMRKIVITMSTHFGDQTAVNIFEQMRGGQWRSTNAITNITILPNVGPNFVANSVFALYGIY